MGAVAGAAVAWLVLAAACGSRTELFVLVPEDAAPPRPDSARVDVLAPPPDVLDAAADATLDTTLPPPDALDALPPIDATFPDVFVNDCPDAGSTVIYVLAVTTTGQNLLYSFYPPTLAFTLIGEILCPSSSMPFSMAVDRTGTGYSVFEDGTLYQVDMATAACVSTPFVTGQDGFSTFGMGFVADTNDTAETLFVAGDLLSGSSRAQSMGLASINTMSFGLSFVGPFTPSIPGAELTGTADGRLFAFYTNTVGTGSNIVEVDKTTGDIIAMNALQVGNPDDAFAFAFWGGAFYVFSGNPTTIVTKFDPSDDSETQVASMTNTVVGAGVSTCAPQ
jgi:hypothetical protein